jgi:hypothetical protein
MFPTPLAGRRLAARTLAVAALVALLLLVVALRQPLDVGARLPMPAWLDRLLDRDEVAYPLHLALGTVLETLRFPPEAAGLQWLKGAAHARTAPEAERLGDGLARTRRRSGDPDGLDAALCRHIIGGGTLGQRATIARAQMRCEPHG